MHRAMEELGVGMSDWRQVRIDEIADKIAIGPFGSRMKSDCYTEAGIPVIRGTNLTGGRSFSGDWVNVYIEDQRQIDALEEFAPKIREILREYRAKRQLSSIAKQLGFHQSRLTEMITKNDSSAQNARIGRSGAKPGH
jgi:hypothetical protein